jgi:hypothetical protein
MTQYRNYSSQIKNEKELKKIIKEAIQLTNNQQLIKRNILKEAGDETSSYEFKDAFSEITKDDANDKPEQIDIVKKNNLMLSILFLMFDKSINWDNVYKEHSLEKPEQGKYKEQNEKDIHIHLKNWVDEIKKAKKVDEFNKATQKLKTELNDQFFYWEPLLILGNFMKEFKSAILDDMFKKIKDVKTNWTQLTGTSNVFILSDTATATLLKEMSGSAFLNFFKDNKLDEDQKKAIWSEAAAARVKIAKKKGRTTDEGAWGWIKSFINGAAALFLGKEYGDIVDQIYMGLDKFDFLFNKDGKADEAGVEKVISGLFPDAKNLVDGLGGVAEGGAGGVTELLKNASELSKGVSDAKSLTADFLKDPVTVFKSILSGSTDQSKQAQGIIDLIKKNVTDSSVDQKQVKAAITRLLTNPDVIKEMAKLTSPGAGTGFLPSLSDLLNNPDFSDTVTTLIKDNFSTIISSVGTSPEVSAFFKNLMQDPKIQAEIFKTMNSLKGTVSKEDAEAMFNAYLDATDDGKDDWWITRKIKTLLIAAAL